MLINSLTYKFSSNIFIYLLRVYAVSKGLYARILEELAGGIYLFWLHPIVFTSRARIAMS